jgi:outer membrane protein assembly factor BamD
MVQAAFEYAEFSIVSKKKERYYDCIEFYEEFLENYPQSKYLKDMQAYYSDSIDEIEKLTEEKL